MKNIPIKNDTQFHIALNGNSAESYVDAYPIGMDNLKEAIQQLLEEQAYTDDGEIEIYVLTKFRIKTTKNVEIIED